MTNPKRPYADPTSKRRSVTVNDKNWKALKAIGQGNASDGIRKLLNAGKPTTNNQNAVKGDQEQPQ